MKYYYTIFKLNYYLNRKPKKSFLSVDKKTQKVIFTSSVKKSKLTFDTLVDAVKFLIKIYPDKKFSLGSYMKDGEHDKTLELWVNRAELEKQCEFYFMLGPFCYIQFNWCGDL
jgi:hypothetical protein